MEAVRSAVVFLGELAQRLTDDGEVAQLHFEMSILEATGLADGWAALAHVERCLARHPRAIHILRAVRRSALRAGSVDAVDASLRLEAKAAHDAGHRVALWVELARNLGERGDVGAAGEAVAEALAVASANPEALALAEMLARQAGDLATAGTRAVALAMAAEDTADCAEHLARAAECFLEANREVDSLEHATRAEKLAPRAPSVALALERAVVANGCLADLSGLRERQIERGDLSVADAGFDLASIARYLVKDPESALVAYERLAAATDTDPHTRLAAFDELAAVLMVVDPSRAAEATRRRADLTEDRVLRTALMVRAGQLLAVEQGLPEQAADVLEQALCDDPGSELAARELGHVLEPLAQWDRLVDALRLTAGSTDEPAQAIVAELRIGEVLAQCAGREADAAASLVRALERAPELARAFEAYLRLPAEVRAEQAEVSPVPAWAPKLLAAGTDVPRRAEVLRGLISTTDDARTRGALRERLGDTEERRGAAADAVAAYLDALAETPDDHAVHRLCEHALVRLARRESRVDWLDDGAARTKGPARGRLLAQAATLAGAAGDAEGALRRMTDAATEPGPHTVHARLELDAGFSVAERLPELVSLLDDHAAAPEAMLRRGVMALSIGDGAGAAQSLRAALSAGALGARLPLLRALEGLKAWADVARVCLTPRPAEGAAPYYAYRAAEALCLRLDRVDDGIAVLQRTRGTVPASTDALVTNLDACPRPLLIAALERLMARAPSPRARVDLGIRRARLLEREGQRQEANAAFAGLLADAPRDPVIEPRVSARLSAGGERERLVAHLRHLADDRREDAGVRAASSFELGVLWLTSNRLREAADAFDAAIALAGPAVFRSARALLLWVHKALGDEQRWLVALRELAAALPRGSERAACLRELGVSLARQPETMDEAQEALFSALMADPQDYVALRALAAIFDPRGERDRLIEPLQWAFSVETDPAATVILSTELGVRLVEAGRIDNALEVIDRAMTLAPNDIHARMVLAEVEQRSQAHHGALSTLSELAAIAPDPYLRYRVYERAAVVALEWLREAPVGRPHIEQAMALAPDEPASLGVLAVLLEALGDPRAPQLRARIHALAPAKAPSAQPTSASSVELSGRAARDVGSDPPRPFPSLPPIELLDDIVLDDEPAPTAGRPSQPESGLAPRPSRPPRVSLRPSSNEVALNLAREAVTNAPGDGDAYRMLGDLLRDSGDVDGGFCCDGVLVGLDLATDAEKTRHRKEAARLKFPKSPLPPAALESLLPSDVLGLAILTTLEPIARATFAVDESLYGAGKKGQDLPAEVAARAAEVATLLDIHGYHVRLMAKRTTPATELAKPAVVLLPTTAADLPAHELRSVLGATLGRIALHTVLCDPGRLDPFEASHVEELVAAACVLTVESTPHTPKNAVVFRDLRARLKRVLTGHAEGTVRSLAEGLASRLAEVDGSAILGATHRASFACALLAGQDPASTLKAMRTFSWWRGTGTLGLSPTALSALSYAVSAEHIDLRAEHEFGLAAST